jgi:hypothetical protein
VQVKEGALYPLKKYFPPPVWNVCNKRRFVPSSRGRLPKGFQMPLKQIIVNTYLIKIDKYSEQFYRRNFCRYCSTRWG